MKEITPEKLFRIVVGVFCLISLTQACHYAEYTDRKKRSTTTTNTTSTSSSDSFDSNRLIYWFTQCMNRTSTMGTYDWGSVTEWTITDSNWFYYTQNSNCKDTDGAEETECWLSRVTSFIDDPVATTLRTCINEYSAYKYSNVTATTASRKKRQASVLATVICPPVIKSAYRRALLLEVPKRRRRNATRYEPEVGVFDIDVVSGFVENYTTCSECSRYNEGETAAQCWTSRFDQLTKDDSSLKEAIQRVNARYAGGGATVGFCKGNVFWTEWYNMDRPTRGADGGDNEILPQVLLSHRTRVCHVPTGVQARTVSDDRPYGRANQTLVLTPLTGLICQNSQQDGERCRDYKVRFCCSDVVGNCPLRYGWTKFFDIDNPRLFGDFELLSRIRRRNPGRVCSDPVAISARLLDGQPYQSGGDILQLAPQIGLTCFNHLQTRKRKCEDYKVRFCCHDTVGYCPNRKMWTRWIDSRTSGGDSERIREIRRNKPRFCPNPIAIRAQVADTHRSFYTGGDRVRIRPNEGLTCMNSEQQDNKNCSNYRVKFCCQKTGLTEVTLAPGNPTTSTPLTTTTARTRRSTTTSPTRRPHRNNNWWGRISSFG